ncbi:MAG: endonuclease MutS2 [Brevinema sp.]
MQEIEFIHQYFLSLLSSETAQNLFRQQEYFQNIDTLNRDLQFSQEIFDYSTTYTSLSFHSVSDIREKLLYSIKDYVLDLQEIYHCHLYLSQWDTWKNLEIPQEKYPLFDCFIDEVFIERKLLTYWNHIFDQEGNILDSASPELLRIRNMKKNIRRQIEKILNTQLQNNEDLAEKRIAFREDRYVLPLKSVAKNRSRGIVHGFSSSGLITYIEPPEIIQLNNELLSVDDLEQQEILRLLREWSHLISENLNDILLIITRSAHLECYFTKYRFAQKLSAQLGSVSTHKEIILKNVYNPFLLLKKERTLVTPITIELDPSYRGIIISGPNAGGKSAALKTLALCVDLFLRGLPIPAQEISLPIFSDLLIEIGDAQNLSDDLSTFSGHIRNIKNILKKCTTNSLILIDEIAHATDPVEGEALARAIIDELIKKETCFAITTHYKQVKIKSFEHHQIKSYAAGFDSKKMKALYTLYPNTIGESYALNIAHNMGLPQHIVKSASDYLHRKQDHNEKILANIEQYEKNLRQKEQQLLEKEQKNHIESRLLQSQKDQLQHLSNQLKEEGLAKADKELNFCLRELSHIQKNHKKNPKEISKQLSQVQQIINEKKQEITNLSRAKKTHISIGETVFIGSLNKDGLVEHIQEANISVRIGILKYSVKKSDIFESYINKNSPSIHIKKYYDTDILNQIDTHGLTVDEALSIVDKYLYRALTAGLVHFTIIHGKGAGILQKAIHKHLNTIPEVQKFHFADPREGGSGKTIVYFN